MCPRPSPPLNPSVFVDPRRCVCHCNTRHHRSRVHATMPVLSSNATSPRPPRPLTAAKNPCIRIPFAENAWGFSSPSQPPPPPHLDDAQSAPLPSLVCPTRRPPSFVVASRYLHRCEALCREHPTRPPLAQSSASPSPARTANHAGPSRLSSQSAKGRRMILL
ncbi:hypothetical protein PVAP13_4KG407301 [Panicum virgatum]|uniref:Uncharacterized protein n=1 Tax=Panicum virgatum TaxID=38727 RepID=A0A8T0TNS0_PANVG|nr:hypothetical protein PVAP13_4KG407301 [Panicum virgatum]